MDVLWTIDLETGSNVRLTGFVLGKDTEGYDEVKEEEDVDVEEDEEVVDVVLVLGIVVLRVPFALNNVEDDDDTGIEEMIEVGVEWE